MREFVNKVAVITGAASGIGLALAHAAARAKMRVVLADVERGALDEATAAVAARGVETLAVPTDVSSADAVEVLAARTIERFGAVHVVCNNAGVAISGPMWTHTLDDWQWLLGVNLWGVIHGVRAFTPIMLQQGEPAHIVNTASIAGTVCAPGTGIYNVSKFGVVALSETLAVELEMFGAPVKVSVLCPGFVNTRILDSVRNRPAELASSGPPPPGQEAMEPMIRQLLASGQAPDQVAEVVFDAIRDERFYVFPNPAWKERIRARMEGMLEERNPDATQIMTLSGRGWPQ
jgi:NAD(P)-dependent dehydrogenase (short-subunit alcohol dehydrogenase family)